MEISYVIWNMENGLSKIIEVESLEIHDINSIYRFYSEHENYDIKCLYKV